MSAPEPHPEKYRKDADQSHSRVKGSRTSRIGVVFWVMLLLLWQLPNIWWVLSRVEGQSSIMTAAGSIRIRVTRNWYPSIPIPFSNAEAARDYAVTFVPFSWLSPWRLVDFIQISSMNLNCLEKDASKIRGVKRQIEIAGMLGYQIETSNGDKATRIIVPDLCVMVSASEAELISNIAELGRNAKKP